MVYRLGPLPFRLIEVAATPKGRRPRNGGPSFFMQESSTKFCEAAFPTERIALPELRTQPAPGLPSELECDGRAFCRYSCGSRHSFPQGAIRIGKIHVHGEVICDLLAQAFELVRLSDRPIRCSGGKDLVHAAGITAVREG